MVSAKLVLQVLADLDVFLPLRLRPGAALAVENLLLRNQLAMYRSES